MPLVCNIDNSYIKKVITMTHPSRLIHNSLLAGLFFSCTGLQGLHAQQRLVLDLERTIALANDSSLESFRTRTCTFPATGNTGRTRRTACPA